jgi:type IV secretory pathway VirB2 component (pilin)
MSDLTPELKGELRGLSKRAAKLTRWGISEAIAGCATALVVGVGWIIARHVQPAAVPSSLDIPPDVLARFSTAVAGAAGSGAGSSLSGLPFSSPLVDLFSALSGPVPLSIAVTGLFVGGGFVIFGDSEYGVVRVIGRIILPISIMLGGACLMKVFIGSPDDTSSSDLSPRDAFVQSVKDLDVPAITKALGMPALDTPADKYVRAQLSLIQPEPRAVATIRSAADWIMTDAGAKFVPRADVAYAIERAAYGAPRSVAAKEYYAHAESTASTIRKVMDVGALSSALCFLAAAGMYGVGRSIKARVRRIETLTGSPSELWAESSPSAMTPVRSERG